MLSKARIKFIKSLQLKKYRSEEQSFVVEGAKSVGELLISDFNVDLLIATMDFLEANRGILSRFRGEIIEVKISELQDLGQLRTNDAALAVARTKPNEFFAITKNEFAIALDDVRDPGNLGTLLRVGDWYGINKFILSTQTADVYNGKVIQASMGSFTRVKCFYTHLPGYLRDAKVPVLGTFLDGENVHTFRFGTEGVIVIGNESNGISPEVEALVSKRITIPRFGKAESLNAAVSAAVICDHIRRKS